MMVCTACGATIDPNARFCSVCGRGLTPAAQSTPLFRPREGRRIAGVCAGLALKYGWDLTLVRVVALILTLCWGGGLLAYIILWIVMPNGDFSLPATTTPGPYQS